MSNYVKIDVLKPGDNKGVGGDKKDKIIIFDWDDVATLPARDGKGIVIAGDIEFNPGAYMSRLYATQSTIKAGADSEGDPDAKGITQSVEFAHPGDSVAIREFRANWMNKNIGVIIEKCSSLQKNLYGTPCSPLQMVFKAEDDKDKNLTTFTFKSIQKGPDVADYQGTLEFDTIKGTAAAGATDVNVLAGEGRYQLTTGVSAAVVILNLLNCVHGGIYTLLGSGGAHPSTIGTTANSFMLVGGSTWTALAGSSITFKAFEADTDYWIYIELARA